MPRDGFAKVVQRQARWLAEYARLLTRDVETEPESTKPTRPDTPAQTGALVTVSEAARVLHCGRSRVFRLLAEGELKPGAKAGRQRTISRESLELYISGRKRRPRKRHTAPAESDTLKEVFARFRGRGRQR